MCQFTAVFIRINVSFAALLIKTNSVIKVFSYGKYVIMHLLSYQYIYLHTFIFTKSVNVSSYKCFHNEEFFLAIFFIKINSLLYICFCIDKFVSALCKLTLYFVFFFLSIYWRILKIEMMVSSSSTSQNRVCSI